MQFKCNAAVVKNTYSLVSALTNKHILVMFHQTKEILYDCGGTAHTTHMQATVLLNSPCRLIVHIRRFSPTIHRNTNRWTQYLYQLQPRNWPTLKSLRLVNGTLARPFVLHPITQASNLVSSSTIICILLALIFIIVKRHWLQDLIYKPRTIIKLGDRGNRNPT